MVGCTLHAIQAAGVERRGCKLYSHGEDSLLLTSREMVKSSPSSSCSAKKYKKVLKYATAKTTAGMHRQVWEGRAKMTKGGLTKADLMISRTGKIVSKRRAAVPMNAYMQLLVQAKKNKAASFVYNGVVYTRQVKRKSSKDGRKSWDFIYYKKDQVR